MIFAFASARLSDKTKTSDDEQKNALTNQASFLLLYGLFPVDVRRQIKVRNPKVHGGIFMDTGNTGFIMICAALVFIMTPGLAFFYGGLVRRKNVVNTMMACVAIMDSPYLCGLSSVIPLLSGQTTAESSEVLTGLH